MSIQRSISLNIPNSSLLALKNGHYKLVVFRGTSSQQHDIKSTVMMTIDATNLNEQNTITWRDQYYAFISQSNLVDGAQVDAATTRAIDLGDELHILSDNTSVDIVSPSAPPNISALTYVNDGNSTVCGYSMVHPDSKAPAQICAASIPGRSRAVLTPLNRFMLMFTSDSAFNENMCVSHIETNAAIVNYDTDTESRNVSYDYTTGYWKEGVNHDAMYGPTNGWLSNVWDTVKKGGSAALNDVLNNVGTVAASAGKAALAAI